MRKNFLKHKAESLIEILIAITIIALILPGIFFMPTGILKSIIELRRHDALSYAAQFYISRLPELGDITEAKILNMPTQTPDGKINFNLISCTKINNNSFKIILEIKELSSNKSFTLEHII
ncbi:MAG: hypothetical protein IJG62_06720 [Synergistaceae bacterium]|nr:hypothetical protein [Synergistaceae bacterium]MBQ4418406.1 hypothetical protein [Synergistaceae bacterium]MBQ6739467.1 hypothetical protein [Synergistaceae bacterium]MBR0096299.1 hypothetical protein [Synergistaceae bacterium]MBR0222199.1 hypothetical protein [Synergistaceae bacterium]